MKKHAYRVLTQITVFSLKTKSCSPPTSEDDLIQAYDAGMEIMNLWLVGATLGQDAQSIDSTGPESSKK